MHRLFWFSLGVAVGATAVWQATKQLDAAKLGSLVGRAGRGLGEVSARAAVFVREFLAAQRQAEAELRQEIGLEL